MMVKLLRMIALFVAFLLVQAWMWTPARAIPVGEGDRAVRSLEAGWRFFRGDVASGESPAFDASAWQTVNLSHTYNASDALDKTPYRSWVVQKAVFLKGLRPGTHSYLEFDEAFLITDVWVNGKKVGRHEGGYARFRFNITSYLKPGQNLVAVRVDNAKTINVAPLGGDFTVFGGLYRSVRLVTTNPLHVDLNRPGFAGGDVAP